jgi:Ca2+-binding EF-hand superfamily protein
VQIEKLKRHLKSEFDSLDKLKRGLVRPQDLQEMLKIRSNVSPPIDLINRLVQRFDSQGKGALNFSEFCNLFLGYMNSINGSGREMQSLLATL